jgi:hypothetical protein
MLWRFIEWVRAVSPRLLGTPRALIRTVFQLCTAGLGAIALYGMWHPGLEKLAASSMAAASANTVLFAVVYGFYCLNVPGEVHRDSLIGKTLFTGRDALRLMGMFCCGLLVVRAVQCIPSFDLVQIFVPLLLAFGSVFLLSLLIRFFAATVPLRADQGAK